MPSTSSATFCNEDYGIGGVPLRALTRPLIQAFYADLERKGRVRGSGPLAPKAVHNVHMILRKALEDAVEEGLLPANPARRAHKLPAIHREMKTWTDEQLASFLSHVRQDPLYALWRLAATTGMRRGELLAATWPRLDLAARRLHVTQALSKGPKGRRFGSARRRPIGGEGLCPWTRRRPELSETIVAISCRKGSGPRRIRPIGWSSGARMADPSIPTR